MRVILSDSKKEDLSGLVDTDNAFLIFRNMVNCGNPTALADYGIFMLSLLKA
jgi:hypothetical protein